MKVIIAGGRNITNYQEVLAAVNRCDFSKEITEVVSGGARGVDSLGEEYAKRTHKDLVVFPADWNQHGKRAGPIRNKQMGDYADALIAVWDGESRGTKHMIDYMTSLNKKVYIHRV